MTLGILDFGREHCGDLASAESLEWLVTNGIGGFAMGTTAGTLTRRYHGLLIAAMKPPLGRTLILSKLDEMVIYRGRSYPLFVNRWAGGTVETTGIRFLERFRLEGTVPVWTFAVADALIEKRLWMQRGVNTTYVQYQLVRASAPVEIRAKMLVNYRDFHGSTEAGSIPFGVTDVGDGLQVVPSKEDAPFYVLSREMTMISKQEWYDGAYLTVESYRGLSDTEAHYYAGRADFTLQPGGSAYLIASVEPNPNLDGVSAYRECKEHERQLLSQYRTSTSVRDVNETTAANEFMEAVRSQLTLAADQFIVRRAIPDDSEGLSVIAGYPWFGDWGRDTMIALPGLTLSTGRPDDAARILRTFGKFADKGMLPNRFPDAGEEPEYNTADATLWYFEALRAYHEATGDSGLIRELYPVLKDIVEWHVKGTRYNLRLDPNDGLIYGGEAGVQMTWMDAKVGDWVVTPRTGKPVEISALWHNALHIMASFAIEIGEPEKYYLDLARRTEQGFRRFWNDSTGYCYDVIDGPEGDDSALRPNQLIAVSLPHSPLSKAQGRSIVDICARRLLTSHGLRSLAPDHPDYAGLYGGDVLARDAAYHQGTVWGWLIGPFASAHLRVYDDPITTGSFLLPLIHHIAGHGLGTISEIFDGDPPFTPRGCPAQAWSVAELLRAIDLTT